MSTIFSDPALGIELERPMPDYYNDELGISYIAKDTLSLFTKWHVSTKGRYKDFRVLRGSKLHREIEETYRPCA